MKVCGTCKQEKNYSEFNKRTASKDGYANMCRMCNSDYQKKYTRENREVLTKKQRQWTESNIDKVKQYKKEYYIQNKFEIDEKNKKYYEDNFEKIQLINKDYYQNNKKHIQKINREYRKKRTQNDDVFKLQIIIRRRLWAFFKNQNKTGKTVEMIGCSWEYLKKYIESKFEDGMTWNNHGYYGWHIDHIIPLSTAKTKDDIHRLNHYTNLQPLWAEDNFKKKDKISEKWGNESPSNGSI